MLDDAQLAEWRARMSADDLPEILAAMERLMAVKRAADPFIEYSHDPSYWQRFGTDAYEQLKAAIFYCEQPEHPDSPKTPNVFPGKPKVTKLEFLD
jgi:hypothetical protein